VFPFFQDGKLYRPLRAEGPGGVIGEGCEEVSPSDPEYKLIVECIRDQPFFHSISHWDERPSNLCD
jgi:hypothetical protein